MTDNLMELNGHKASISYDPELDTFRGDIIGYDDAFFGSSIKELREEFEATLEIHRGLREEEEKGLFSKSNSLRDQYLKEGAISKEEYGLLCRFAENGKCNSPNKKFVAAISFVHDLRREESMAILRFVNAPTKEEAIAILEGTDWEAEFPEYIQDGVDDIQEITP